MANAQFLQVHLWFAAIIVFFGGILYQGSLGGDFQFDDHPVIVHNPVIKEASPLNMIQALSHPSRTITYLTFWWNHQQTGLETRGYHLLNVGIHVTNGVLLYFLMILLGNSPVGERIKKGLYWPGVALTAAILFICHPLHTQAVSYITQRFTSLATLFYLASLCCFLKGRMSAVTWRRTMWWVLTVTVTVLGMFTKQITLTIPFMLILLEWSFFDRRSRSGVIALMGVGAIFIAIIPALYQFRVADILSITHENGNHPGDIINSGTYAITQPRVIVTYLRLLFLPIGQTLLHDFPVSTGLSDPRLIGSFLILMALLIGVWISWSRCRFISWGIMWFFIALLVEASIIPIRHVIFEHRAYLPSIGIIMLVSWMLHRMISSRVIRTLLIVCCVSLLSFLSIQRQAVWRDSVAMWTDVVRKNPGNARSHYNLGYEYLKKGAVDNALQHLDMALLINPEYELAYLNRSQLLLDLGNTDLALHDINKVIELNHRRAEAYLNRGTILRERGQWGEAVKDFRKAQELKPDLVAAVVNHALTLGNLARYSEGLQVIEKGFQNSDPTAKMYSVKGALQMGEQDLTGALESFSQAIALNSNGQEAYRNRAQVYQALGQYERADQDLTALITLTPKNTDLYLQRAYVRTRLHRLTEALQDYQTVAVQQPSIKKVYLERGKIFYRQGQYEDAVKELDQYLNRAPAAADAFMLRGLTRYELRQFQKALADFQRARKLGYDVAETYFQKTKQAMGQI